MPTQDSEPLHSGTIQILLVDDHPHIRQLLRETIQSYDDLSIVGEAVNGEEAVLLAAKLKPAAVVMDIHLPVLSGVPATTLIKINNPFTAVIGLTAGDPQEDEKAMSIAGAALVLNKSEVLHGLYPAIVAAVKQVKNPV
ncbi:MAG TPA: response regulator transcription factor [Nitrospira sp.]|nr:response regulator transcription factor [Nitrospira sp.]